MRHTWRTFVALCYANVISESVIDMRSAFNTIVGSLWVALPVNSVWLLRNAQEHESLMFVAIQVLTLLLTIIAVAKRAGAGR